jgi:hypothetical protein
MRLLTLLRRHGTIRENFHQTKQNDALIPTPFFTVSSYRGG